jgi:5-deoxy-glucuronate isomerase
MASFSDSEKLKRIELIKQSYTLYSDSKEIVVILLSGSFETRLQSFSRGSVFEAPPVGFYCANDGDILLEVSNYAEICVIESKQKNKIPLSVIDHNSTKIKAVGKKNYSRVVKTIVDSTSGLKNLIVGETIKTKGNWSSWPPHKHDSFAIGEESKQKEIYLYKFREKKGFGVQLVYDGDAANPIIVKNNDEVKIGSGYHPVVASPRSEMYYLWALFGDNSFFKVRYEE